MNALLRIVAISAFLLAAGSCASATQFTGEPHFPGGAAGCQATCQKSGLEMSGFVYSGEFASSCVCRVPRMSTPSASSSPEPDSAETSTADDAVAVGIVMQMRAAAEQQRRNSASRPR